MDSGKRWLGVGSYAISLCVMRTNFRRRLNPLSDPSNNLLRGKIRRIYAYTQVLVYMKFYFKGVDFDVIEQQAVVIVVVVVEPVWGSQ
jgi:hypothetical protein